jgi:heptosyltransferase-2
MSDPRRLLVLAPNWLGDAVMALPAIADVASRRPGVELVVAARGAVAGLFGMVRAVDRTVVLEWKGRAAHLSALRHDVAVLRASAPDAALLLPNSFASALLARAAGIRERWGYAGDLRTPLLTRAIPRPAASLHQGEYYQHLTRHLGFPSGPLEPAIVPPESAVADARTLLTGAGWRSGTPLVVLAPGAAYGTAKQWLPRHFATLATDLVTKHGALCVLVGSAADSAAAVTVRGLVAAGARERIADLTGRTTLSVLAGVLHLAQACVSNDSGAMHLAAAAGVPLVALFGPTNERETSPLPRAGVLADVLVHQVSCRPCMLRTCPIDHPCMRDLTPARALVSVERLLDSARNSRR